jgi:hypothetical protein
VPFIILGIVCVVGGVAAYAMSRKSGESKPGTDVPPAGVVGVGAELEPSGMAQQGITNASHAEGEAGTVPIRADEGSGQGDRYASSRAAHLTSVIKSVPEDVFPDEQNFDPNFDFSSPDGDKFIPDDDVPWVFDDIEKPDDIADALTDPDIGNANAHLVQ